MYEKFTVNLLKFRKFCLKDMQKFSEFCKFIFFYFELVLIEKIKLLSDKKKYLKVKITPKHYVKFLIGPFRSKHFKIYTKNIKIRL